MGNIQISRIECDFELFVSGGHTVFSEETISPQEPVKGFNLSVEKFSPKKIKGKISLERPFADEIFTSGRRISSLEILKKVFNTLGIVMSYSNERFYNWEGKKFKRISTSFGTVAKVCEYGEKILISRILTNNFLERIQNDPQKVELICFWLNLLENRSNLFLPLYAFQLWKFLEKNYSEFFNSICNKPHSSSKPKELMENGNEIFERTAGFPIGELLNKGVDKRTKYAKYSPKGDSLFWKIAKKFGYKDKKSAIFMLFRVLRNAVVHLTENIDKKPSKLNGLRTFIMHYGSIYVETVKRYALEWLGIEYPYIEKSSEIFCPDD